VTSTSVLAGLTYVTAFIALVNLLLLDAQWALTFTAFALACHANVRVDRGGRNR
jgi:hypothetical protein